MPESKRRKPKRPSLARTPTPAAKSVKLKTPSPTWYVALMAGLMGVGVVLVLLRFVFELQQWLLIAGLGAIAAGFLMTTNYR
jgi:hypothetical protein